jgi:hypothetical protein
VHKFVKGLLPLFVLFIIRWDIWQYTLDDFGGAETREKALFFLFNLTLKF